MTGRMSLPLSRQAQILALLFAADRLDHVTLEVAPRLRDGYVASPTGMTFRSLLPVYRHKHAK